MLVNQESSILGPIGNTNKFVASEDQFRAGLSRRRPHTYLKAVVARNAERQARFVRRPHRAIFGGSIERQSCVGLQTKIAQPDPGVFFWSPDADQSRFVTTGRKDHIAVDRPYVALGLALPVIPNRLAAG